jgi:hypothetical protein
MPGTLDALRAFVYERLDAYVCTIVKEGIPVGSMRATGVSQAASALPGRCCWMVSRGSCTRVAPAAHLSVL